ncbi:hypothetical protein [Merismopedia glauca]|uniref:Uncharacterized protein n=1 Tax=Merismopedia glauca CCAP 1448/3 TaxID=1296344 RepID=A0A2T1C6B4_9CYAN|nr:hypothetical protein [Merismopedia glauca]PSB03683.1 hypothetical protein C7B64_07125 [Merismopedia glauca CCAP 1448/3]
MLKLLNFRFPNRHQLLPIGLLFAIMSVELAAPVEAFESQTGTNGNPTATVSSDLPQDNLVARCRIKSVYKRRRSVIIRRGPFVYRGRRYGRNYVLRRVYPARRVRTRVCS